MILCYSILYYIILYYLIQTLLEHFAPIPPWRAMLQHRTDSATLVHDIKSW